LSDSNPCSTASLQSRVSRLKRLPGRPEPINVAMEQEKDWIVRRAAGQHGAHIASDPDMHQIVHTVTYGASGRDVPPLKVISERCGTLVIVAC